MDNFYARPVSQSEIEENEQEQVRSHYARPVDETSADETPAVSTAEDGGEQYLRNMAQGMFLEGGDELEAGIVTAGGLLGDYDKTLADIRRKIKLSQEQYPIKTAAAQLAGAVPTVVAGTLLTKSPQPARMALTAPLARISAELGKQALLGTGGGAVAGFLGEEGGFEKRVGGASTGALVGAVTAPVFGLALKGVGLTAQAAIDFTRRRFGKTTTDRVARDLQRIVQESGMTPDEIIERMKNGETFAEMSETATQALKGFIASGTASKDEIVKEIKDRAKTKAEAVYDFSEKTIGAGEDVNIAKYYKTDLKAVKDDASRVYDEVFENAPPLPDEAMPAITSVLKANTPDFNREVINTLDNLISYAKPEQNVSKFYEVTKNGVLKITRKPTLREAELVKRAFRDVADGKPSYQAAAIKDLEKIIQTTLDKVSPALSQARLKWSKIEQGKKAYDDGYKALRMSSLDLAREAFEKAQRQGPEALRSFRLGVAADIRDKQTQVQGTSFLKKLGDADKKEGALLEDIFPQGSYDEMAGLLDKSTRARGVEQALPYGGSIRQSQTGIIGEEIKRQGSSLNTFADVADIATSSNPVAITRMLARLIPKVTPKSMTPEQQRRVAELLYKEVPDLFEKAVNDDRAYRELQNRVIKTVRTLQRTGAITTGVTAPEPVERASEVVTDIGGIGLRKMVEGLTE